MNSVLIGVDFAVTDDDVKLLELNTEVGISSPMISKFDFVSLFNYINTNNISTLHLIYKEVYIAYQFIDEIKSHCLVNNVNYLETLIESNAIFIPEIAEDESTLILRLAYNSQAILDDLYCRDKSELIKLLFDNNLQDSIPKTYSVYNDNVTVSDNLTTLNDNGIIPNLIVKKSLPDAFKKTYPAFYNLQTNEELENLKSSLPDETVLQEYLYAPNTVIDSTIVNHIRYWFLLSNGLSDVVDCGGYIGANSVQIEENLITYTDNKLENIARAMFFSNPGKANSDGVPHDYLVKVKNTDDTFVDKIAGDIQVGDIIEAVDVKTLDSNFNRTQTEQWTYTGPLEELLTYTTASVISVMEKEIEDWFYKIEYSTGTSLLPNGKLILVEDNGVVSFKNVVNLKVGDVIFNNPSSFSTITSISNEYYSGTMTIINIDPSDVYIAGNVTNEIMNTLVVHNYEKTT
jgi:hypothetical protein